MKNKVDEYINQYPKKIQWRLKEIRSAIKKAAPQAEEIISYGMPAYKLNGMLVWFAAHTKHIGFYPRVSGIEKFKNELSKYKTSKGSVQFPNESSLPINLITKIVKFRLKEILQRAKTKAK
jgi:uncharacterized protein YdhG (YjbR/CyaY superfamily)